MGGGRRREGEKTDGRENKEERRSQERRKNGQKRKNKEVGKETADKKRRKRSLKNIQRNDKIRFPTRNKLNRSQITKELSLEEKSVLAHSLYL